MKKHVTRRKPPHDLNADFRAAERAIGRIHLGIQAEMERLRDLEVEHARALYRSGKAKSRDAKEVIADLRRRFA